ncbi:MAG: hypothetical protein IKO05_00905 [Selenomonadaceae bacterium]|nr:hypothetical protein [Selenomonadaceae bacterium]
MKISYEDLLYLFEHDRDHVDETAFYFDDDPEEDEHYIGCQPMTYDGKRDDKPYQIGLCDIDTVEGRVFATAKELFEAKVFDGKSIKERWEHVVVFQIGGAGIEDYMEYAGKEFLSNRKRINE